MRINVITLFVIFITSFGFTQEFITTIDTVKFDEMYDVLAKKRAGLSDEQINSLENPFLLQDIALSKEIHHINKDGFELMAIIGNRAKINNQWLNIGEYLNGYVLDSIEHNFVIISNQTDEIRLILDQGNGNALIQYR